MKKAIRAHKVPKVPRLKRATCLLGAMTSLAAQRHVPSLAVMGPAAADAVVMVEAVAAVVVDHVDLVVRAAAVAGDTVAAAEVVVMAVAAEVTPVAAACRAKAIPRAAVTNRKFLALQHGV
jgi:hypothetical protein